MPTKPENESKSSYAPATPETPTQPIYPKASGVEDVIDIFYTPSTVFARRERTSFWMPYLIVTLVAAVFVFVNRGVFSVVFDAEFHRGAARALASNPRITQEQLDSMRGMQEKVGHILQYVFTPIFIFFVALFTWLAAKVVSAKVSLEQAMLIVTFAWIPRFVEQVLIAVQNIVFGTDNVTSMASFSFNVARFLDADAVNHRLFTLATRADIFTLWVTLLIAIGVSTIGRVSRAKGYAAAGMVYGLATVLTVLLT